MKGREINWKIYLVIDSQEHSMLFCAQMKPGVVSKNKSNLHDTQHAQLIALSFRMYSTLSGKHAKRASLSSSSSSSLRYAFRECVPMKFSLLRFDQRIALIHSFSFFTTALTHSFRFVCSFLFFLPTSTVDYKFSRSKRNDVVRDPVKIDENCTSRSTPLHSGVLSR